MPCKTAGRDSKMKLSIAWIPFLIVWLVLSFSVRVCGKTYVIFRYNNMAADSPGVRESDIRRKAVFEAEKAVDSLFLRFGFPYVAAIIPARYIEYGKDQESQRHVPFYSDKEKTLFVQQAVQAGRLEVAQLGYSHTNHTKKGHQPAEFRDRTYQEQLRDIKAGKDILRQMLGEYDVEIFVPPWNSWNEHTAQALHTASFKVLSADLKYFTEPLEGLALVPFTCQLWELEALLDGSHWDQDSIIVVLYHPAQIVLMEDFKHRYYGVQRFERLLRKISYSPAIQVTTFGGLLREGVNLTTRRYHLAHTLSRQLSFWGKLLPSHIRPGQSYRGQYVSAEIYSREVKLWRFLTIVFVACLLGIGAGLGYLVARILGHSWIPFISLLAASGIVASIFKEVSLVLRGFHMTGISAVPGILAVGFLVAYSLRIRRQARMTVP